VYERVIWSFTLKEKHTRLRVFENGELRKIFRSLADAIRRECTISGFLIFIRE
jgi:hypothetical protein